MNHLPYIAAAYGLTLAVAVGFSLAAWIRMTRARRRLDAVDPRARAATSPRVAG
ncbi:MAG: heme exporter protein CcmD [Rhodospirillales bacterium]|nr:heme exporter protein CcmD [Rhodospirillales bacterium]MDE2199336.1 heme exporter protein CcmD [Rhodospirillales bacterium]MDE2575921.1 heme exporter protein CcmD [Rhodospirillales bacterium]